MSGPLPDFTQCVEPDGPAAGLVPNRRAAGKVGLREADLVLGVSLDNWLVGTVDFLLYWLSAASVFKSLGAILATGFVAAAADRFQVWSNVAGGLVFFAMAWATFERCIRMEQISEPDGPNSPDSRRLATRSENAHGEMLILEGLFVCRERTAFDQD